MLLTGTLDILSLTSITITTEVVGVNQQCREQYFELSIPSAQANTLNLQFLPDIHHPVGHGQCQEIPKQFLQQKWEHGRAEAAESLKQRTLLLPKRRRGPLSMLFCRAELAEGIQLFLHLFLPPPDYLNATSLFSSWP